MEPFQDFNNARVAALPQHLRQYIVPQHYERYTPVDHAVWRYVMRQNYSYLKDAAYYPYIPGLKMAGLTIEKIPSLQEINDALAGIGWGAVTVDGFIPPAAFMEYQACQVLVIAADIRQLHHIEYTSAPDIIHESAGHAPIISDFDYQRYLSYLGWLGTRALFSARDFELYEAIRQLSIIKETPHTPPEQVEAAEQKVMFLQKNMGAPSEMALLSRLQWWTVEYGLIGTTENPKIYGAGLLSSIGESKSCMRPEVKKIPYTIDAVNYAYDITQPQPQLFVTPDFQTLLRVLHEFESRMAFRVGGASSVEKAIACRNVCTAVFSSGLQLTGVFSECTAAADNGISWIATEGPSALSLQDRQLDGQGKDRWTAGFMTPVGRWSGIDGLPEDLTEQDFNAMGWTPGRKVHLIYDCGISVEGLLKEAVWKSGKLLLLGFTRCTVKDKEGKIRVSPASGEYWMAVGTSIVSVFNGAADKAIFEDSSYVSKENTYRVVETEADMRYRNLFSLVRAERERGQPQVQVLRDVWNILRQQFTNDWLCALEIAELLAGMPGEPTFYEEVRQYLENKALETPEFTKLIRDGLGIIDSRLEFV